MNQEIAKVKICCDTNKLSINFKKTNYMIYTTRCYSDKHTIPIGKDVWTSGCYLCF